jgi:hypothetical protein
MKHIVLHVPAEFDSITLLAVRVSTGRLVVYGMNDTAARSQGRKALIGKADRVHRSFSRRLELDGHPNRNMSLNMWQDEPIYIFWRPELKELKKERRAS